MKDKPLTIWRRPVLAWLLILLLFTLYWVQLLQSHKKLVENAEQATLLRGEQAAHALAMQARSQLLKIEFFLEHLAEHWFDHDPAVFNKLIGMGQKDIFRGALQRVLVTDAKGQVLFDSLGTPAEQPDSSLLADRDHWQRQGTPRSPFVIGPPVANARTGQWAVPFSYALERDGAFAGAVTASVSAEHLAQAFTHIYPHRENVVLLTLNDGRYLTRSQDLSLHLGAAVPEDRDFIRNPRQNSGQYRVIAPIDGIERYYAWYRVPDYPVVLSLGLSREQALAQTLQPIRHSKQQSLLVSLIVLIAAVWISRYAVLRARQHRLLLQAQERLEALLDHIPSGVLLEDENNHLFAANSKFCQLLKITVRPAHLQGLHHEEFMALLGAEHTAHLPLLQDRRAEGYRKEIEEASGRTLEIEWVPIRREQRDLGHAWFIRDISSRKQKELELLNLASVDPLTGLLNRRSFMKLLANSIDNSSPHLPGALLSLDIDHFKQVNDTYGHPAGDMVLQHVAQIIRSSLRKGDYTGRLGGEEFAVLLPTATHEEAILLAERIRTHIAGAVTDTPEHGIAVTLSIGISLLHGQTLESVRERADKALYQAKNSGRNRICLHQEEVFEHARD